jgi:hypothetical protein
LATSSWAQPATVVSRAAGSGTNARTHLPQLLLLLLGALLLGQQLRQLRLALLVLFFPLAVCGGQRCFGRLGQVHFLVAQRLAKRLLLRLEQLPDLQPNHAQLSRGKDRPTALACGPCLFVALLLRLLPSFLHAERGTPDWRTSTRDGERAHAHAHGTCSALMRSSVSRFRCALSSSCMAFLRWAWLNFSWSRRACSWISLVDWGT